MTERTKGKRPDYKILGTTGDFVEKDSGVQPVPETAISDFTQINSSNSTIKMDEDDVPTDILGATSADVEIPAVDTKESDKATLELPKDLLDKDELLEQQQEKHNLLRDEWERQETEHALQKKAQAADAERMRWVMQQQQEEMNRKANQDQFNQANKAANQLIGQAISLSDDIEDFIEENPSDELGNSVVDLDKIISRMEELRSSFRAKHNELKILYEDNPGKYTGQLEKECTTTLEKVKKYRKK